MQHTECSPHHFAFFLLHQSSDTSAAKVQVFHLNHPAELVLTLGCPGARPNMAVAWDQGSKSIYRFEHSAGGNSSMTPPRLQIDSGHHLVFQPAKVQDSGSTAAMVLPTYISHTLLNKTLHVIVCLFLLNCLAVSF